jgi:hypothetical protein
MSTKITTEIWEHSSAEDSALLLLLALADHADSVHAQCWPSVARLARLIRKSERNTRYLLRKLEEGSHIAVKFKGSAHQTNVYQILRPWAMGQELLQEHNCAGATHCPTTGATVVAPDPNSEPKPEEKQNAHAREEGEITRTGVTENFLRHLGLTPGGESWEAALQGNGHHQDGRAKTNGFPGRNTYANGTYPYSGR